MRSLCSLLVELAALSCACREGGEGRGTRVRVARQEVGMVKRTRVKMLKRRRRWREGKGRGNSNGAADAIGAERKGGESVGCG